jgi:hypothetical protein
MPALRRQPKPLDNIGVLLGFSRKAIGRADALTGRFLAVEWDVEELVRRGEGRAGTDALTLRLVPPPPGP